MRREAAPRTPGPGRVRRAVRYAALGACAAAIWAAAWVAWPLPGDLLRPDAAAGLTLTDRDGAVLRSTRADDGLRRRWMPLGDIDATLLVAFVATEDRRFWGHHGIDWRGVARAARDNLLAGHVVSGGSTITMQLARLLRPAGRSWVGKARQAMWAARLEAHLSKQAILEQYLNRVALGQGTVGVASAADLYFGRSAASLSLGQAALLAGLAHAPSRDNPLVAPRRAAVRRAFALRRLAAAGYASHADVARAVAEPVRVAPRDAPFLAPHFTTAVLGAIDDAREAGCGGARARPGPLSETTAAIGCDGPGHAAPLRTSLDLTLQDELEAEVRQTVFAMRDRGVRHAAVVVLDNATGGILAWVGSPDFWADTAGQTDMVISPRQPGSALKPFLYGLAFDRGATPATVLADVARTYLTTTGPYRPRNYDRTYHGPVRAREALASSFNVPAVALADEMGAASLLGTLRRAGFRTLTRAPEYYGIGLALGNGDVTLLDLADAYRALARGGVWTPVRWAAGEPSGDGGRRVMSARSAALVLDILSDPDARIPGFGVATPFDFPFRAAVKTGTSRHFTDNWAVGTTAGFTIATWAGNFDGRPMDGVSGVAGAGPLLRAAMLYTARRHPPGELVHPVQVGAVPVEICRVSGMLAGPDCPHAVEWFAPGTAPTAECDWHRDGRLVLPPAFAEWAAGGGRVAGAEARGVLMEAVGRDGAERGGTEQTAAAAAPDSGLHILSPRDGDRYRIPPGVPARYATLPFIAAVDAAAVPANAIRWFVDGRPLDGGRGRWPLVAGRHVVRAEAAGRGRARAAPLRAEVRIVVE